MDKVKRFLAARTMVLAVVTISLSPMPTTLDWSASHKTNAPNYPVILAMMYGLTSLDSDLKPVPCLAGSWDIGTSGGKQVYTFHLRKDIVWSDGKTKLTAADFVLGWKRAILGADSAEMADIAGFDEVQAARASRTGPEEKEKLVKEALDKVGVEAVDAATLRVTLKGPRSYFLSKIAYTYVFLPDPAKDLAGKSEQEIRRYFNEPKNGKPMVLGAFRPEKWDRAGQQIELTANPHARFAPDEGRMEKLVLKEAQASPLLYDQCQVDFLAMDDPRWLSNPPADLQTTNLLSVYYLSFNTTRVPLALRRAVAQAIDRKALFEPLKGQLPGLRTAKLFLPPEMPGALPPGDALEARVPGFDREQARRAAAEYRDRKLTLLVRGEGTFMPETAIAEGLRGQLEAAGIRVEVRTSSDLTKDAEAGNPDGTTGPDIMLKRLGADYPHPQTLLTPFLRNGNNYTDWDRIDNGAGVDELDRILAAGAGIDDPRKAAEIYGRAQELLQGRYVVLVPLFYPNRYYRTRGWIEGLEIDPLNFITFRNMHLAPAPGIPAR